MEGKEKKAYERDGRRRRVGSKAVRRHIIVMKDKEAANTYIYKRLI